MVMNQQQEQHWFVRFRGHTLGPLTSEQVKSSVQKKELSAECKLASASNPAWRPLGSQPEFQNLFVAPEQPLLQAPVPPQFLWKKKRSPLPTAPEPVVEEVKAEIIEEKEPDPIQAPIMEVAPVEPIKKTPKPKARPPQKKRSAKSATVSAPIPAAPTRLAPQEIEASDALSLLESLRDWSRKEQEAHPPTSLRIPKEAPPIFIPSTPIANPPIDSNAPKSFNVQLTVSKQFIIISSVIGFLAIAAILLVLIGPEKMRGLENFRLPDPSSPTAQPSTENDPIPQLKAPTRPKRD